MQASLQYYQRKFQACRDPHEIQNLSSIIMGGMVTGSEDILIRYHLSGAR